MAGSVEFVCLFIFLFAMVQSQNIDIEAPTGIDVDSIIEEQSQSAHAGTTKTSHQQHASTGKTLGDHELRLGRDILIPSHISSNHLEVFCYQGERKVLRTFFKTVEVHLDISSPSYRFYESGNASEVRRLYAGSSWFSFSPWRPTTFRMDLYNKSCVGIETAESYRVMLRIRFLDLWRVLAACAGALVFVGAARLARNLLFHYMTGSVLGVLGSFIILIVIVARYIPKRSGALSFMVGGSGLFLYLLQLLYVNFVYLINEYYTVFLGYIAITGLMSFALVYRWGPVADQRSLQLLQWLLQGGGLIAVYCSSQYREATLALVLLLLVYHNTPPVLANTCRTVWRRRFPPKVTLLTDEEYLQQGNASTTEALEGLRNYCKSPQCNAWRTFSTLQTPVRFAEFVEGSSHLVDNEILQYEHSHYSRGARHSPMDVTDDEDNLTDDSDSLACTS